MCASCRSDEQGLVSLSDCDRLTGRGEKVLAGAFEIVMAERKALVDKIISMMKREGGFFHNRSEWDRAALRPQNPLSKVWYRGGNRMKLMAIVTEKG